MLAGVWRKVIRRVWKLPYRTHTAILPYLMKGQSFRSIIYSRFRNFAHSCINSQNINLNFIARNAMVTPLSRFGNNLYLVNNINLNLQYNPHISMLLELVFARDGCFFTNLSNNEIECILYDICCN